MIGTVGILLATMSCRVLLPSAGADDQPAGVLFSEAFDNARIFDRGWYDGDATKFHIAREGTHSGAGCVAFHWKADKTPDFSGSRHLFEAMFQLNSLDLQQDKPNPDGVVRAWFDDLLVVDHSDVILRSTDFPKMKFNQFLLTPHFGPGLLPHEQTLWIDELAEFTKRVGPLEKDSKTAIPQGVLGDTQPQG
jgi:hypothetical protein